ncbi:MAG TPA: VanZ family protein, partial [Anaerolineae bacterium]|nr:VanZ family protein [Anaerolineae bacterium]
AWLIVIFIGSSIGNVPRVGGKTTDGVVHRIAHIAEFAVLGGLLLRALRRDRTVTKREIVITLIVAALYGASDEFHQRFTPGRSSEGLSILFDVAGGVIGVAVYRGWLRRKAAGRRANSCPGRTAARQVDPSREGSLDR